MESFIPRIAEERFRKLLKTFPAVMVGGPRQCGKTTLIHKVLPAWQHLDLERKKRSRAFFGPSTPETGVMLPSRLGAGHNGRMATRRHAQPRGRPGGLARVRKLSPAALRRFASQGGLARVRKLSPAALRRFASQGGLARARKIQGRKTRGRA